MRPPASLLCPLCPGTPDTAKQQPTDDQLGWECRDRLPSHHHSHHSGEKGGSSSSNSSSSSSGMRSAGAQGVGGPRMQAPRLHAHNVWRQRGAGAAAPPLRTQARHTRSSSSSSTTTTTTTTTALTTSASRSRSRSSAACRASGQQQQQQAQPAQLTALRALPYAVAAGPLVYFGLSLPLDPSTAAVQAVLVAWLYAATALHLGCVRACVHNATACCATTLHSTRNHNHRTMARRYSASWLARSTQPGVPKWPPVRALNATRKAWWVWPPCGGALRWCAPCAAGLLDPPSHTAGVLALQPGLHPACTQACTQPTLHPGLHPADPAPSRACRCLSAVVCVGAGLANAGLLLLAAGKPLGYATAYLIRGGGASGAR